MSLRNIRTIESLTARSNCSCSGVALQMNLLRISTSINMKTYDQRKYNT